jgi:hypothetical protein
MTYSPNDIAQAINALINSRPTNPTMDESVAILEAHKALPAPSAARETYLASEWCRALDAYLDASSRRYD